MQIWRGCLMFSLSVPMQYIFIGLQTPEVPKPLDPRMPMFYTNYAYGRLFWVVFIFLIISIVFSYYSSNLLASSNAKFPVLFESCFCQNGNLIDYLLVSKAFNHSFGRASKHALSQERVVWARKALALERGCHSDWNLLIDIP